MNKIIFFVAALVVLVGVGVGGWIMFGQQMMAEAAGTEEHAEPKKKEKKKAEGPPSFVDIGPIVLPVMGETRIEQTVMLMVAIEVADQATKTRVNYQSPRLLDAYLRALYGKIGKSQVAEGQIVDIAAVKDKLTEATNEVLGPDVADGVYIKAVSQRPAF